MKFIKCVVAAAVLVGGASLVQAEELKSGLEAGKPIPAFNVTKCAGSEGDKVKIGDNLCYRCKYGARPMVMVFARKADSKLALLTKDLSTAIEKNEDKQLKAFVNLLGEDREATETSAKKFGAEVKAENVPIVVPDEFSNGPGNYSINPKAGVTVIIATGGKTVTSLAYDSKDLDVKAVMAEVAKLVK